MAEMKASGLKALNLIHKAMLGGQILFGAITFYLVVSATVKPVLDESTERIFQVIAVVFAAAGFFIGTFLMKKKILDAKDMSGTAQEKFNLFRAGAIVQWALLEGPSLFCIICFLLSGNYAFLALAGVIIIFFALLGPAKNKLLFQLNLSEEEVDGL
jgi:hypothetical protein